MTEPTHIVGPSGAGPYRNFTCDIEAVRKRALEAFEKRFDNDHVWPDQDKDAMYLALLVDALVDEKLELAERLNRYQPDSYRPVDLCPCCGGSTWGRPALEGRPGIDYKRRSCHVCGWVRDDPPEPQSALEPAPDPVVVDDTARLGIECGHTECVSINGYTVAAEAEPVDEEIDATDWCPDCNKVKLWGIGWMDPPPPHPDMQERLDALRKSPNPCQACGRLLGEAVNCDNLDCPTNADSLDDVAEQVQGDDEL